MSIPNTTDVTLTEQLADAYAADLARAQELLDAQTRLPTTCEIGDTETLDKLANYVRLARAHGQLLETKRKDEKGRFDALGREVQSFFTPWQTKLDAAKAQAERVITVYTQRKEAEERRIRQEAAERERVEAERRAEAAREAEAANRPAVAEAIMEHAMIGEQNAADLERSAQGKAADLVRTTTEAGTVSGKTVWEFEISDQTALRQTLGPLGRYFTVAAIEPAIRQYLAECKRLGVAPLLDGVVFSQTTKAIIR